MEKIKRFDLAVLCLTALFVLAAAGYFLWTGSGDESWQVDTVRRD